MFDTPLAPPMSPEAAMRVALDHARTFRGATSPNPPVGAVGLDPFGRFIGVAAHHYAGGFHAERALLEFCAKAGTLNRLHTMVVTLEPCTHIGRTPPCTEAIRHSPVQRVIVGTLDPNPVNRGRGIARLRELGLDVSVGILEAECAELIEPFRRHILGLRPFVTVKTALTADGSMIPPVGQKTFTSRDSLTLAHELRKRSDAVITGSGTVLADDPSFTVRLVADHPKKRRILVILDRRQRVPETYIHAATERGFDVRVRSNLEEAILEMGRENVLEILVEAGPALTESVLATNLWDEHVRIQAAEDSLQPDRVTIERARSEAGKTPVPVPLRTTGKRPVTEENQATGEML